MADSMRYEWRRMVVRDPHLSDATRRVLLELESYADPDGTNARPGVRAISENLLTAGGKHGHISDRTVRTALAAAVTRGFVTLTEKAPRGRGNRRADVYRLTFPENVIPEVQTAGNADDGIAETQTAGIGPVIPAIEPGNSGNPEPKYRQSGLPTTSSTTPVPFPPENSRLTFRNAGARDENRFPSQVENEPSRDGGSPTFAPDPDTNPESWIDNALPGGFLTGERERTRELLDGGKNYSSVKFALLRERTEEANRIRNRNAALRRPQTLAQEAQ